jgi:hypothetical protein
VAGLEASVATSFLLRVDVELPLVTPPRRFLPSLGLSPSLPLLPSPRARPRSPPWPPPRPAASRLPASRRARPEVRRAALFLPVYRIGPRWTESPPPSPLPRRTELLRRQNPPLPALLRPNRHRRRPPGEATVLLDPFPLLLPRRSAGSVVTGGSPPWPGLPWPLRQRGLRVGLGSHRSVAVGQFDPGAKRPCTLF